MIGAIVVAACAERQDPNINIADAEELAHLRAVMASLSSAIVTFDPLLHVTYYNSGVETLLGARDHVLRQCTTFMEVLEACAVLGGEGVKAAYEAALAAVADRSRPRAPLLLRALDSRVFTLRISATADGRHLAAFEDVTAMRAAEDQALANALRDPLTDLPNRRVFVERLANLLRRPGEPAPACALLLIDLDRFKTVNDTLGHPIGDALLKLVAKRLGSAIREDEVAARLGGDEFALFLLPSEEPDRIAGVAKRIVDLLARPYLIDGHLVHIGASIGIACAPQDGTDADQVFRNADLALYQSKSGGRSRFTFFEPGMDERANARRSLEIDLRKAIALREFELHYQPQVDIDHDTISGFEALIRWRHPTRGLVPPNDFIPLCEEIGLIGRIGEWVLREACREASGWPSPLSVAVNVASQQFDDAAGLVASVKRALALSGLPGERLEIEITESAILRDAAVVQSALHQLHDLGVKIAMDDFGTGYSSLSQLHQFPFDKIKIDKSLLTRHSQGADPAAMIRAIAAMGVSLGMRTIAEGVETEEQLANLKSVGCTSVQGYLFGKPVPATAVADILTRFAEDGRRLEAA